MLATESPLNDPEVLVAELALCEHRAAELRNLVHLTQGDTRGYASELHAVNARRGRLCRLLWSRK